MSIPEQSARYASASAKRISAPEDAEGMTLSTTLAHHVASALRGLRYGSIQLVIHDGQIVRIERIERIRLTETSEASSLPLSQPTDSNGGSRHAHQED